MGAYRKMDPIWKDKWVKALRSGDYQQGQNYLNRGGNFCCLGVLCEIAGVEKDLDTFNDFYTYDGASSIPMPATQKKFGLSDAAMYRLISMNDGTRMYKGDDGYPYTLKYGTSICSSPLIPKRTFLEIADWIEQHL